MSTPFHHAIVRMPCRAMTHGIREVELGIPDYQLAKKQHQAYIHALETAGLKVLVLPADEDYPDSCFVEDTAICTRDFAILCRPGAQSRLGETEKIRPVLKTYFPEYVDAIVAPGHLEGGDVMMVGNHFTIGLSNRTNREGANQLIQHMQTNGKTATALPIKDMLHLKTGVSYLEKNNLLICEEWADSPVFSSFQHIVVPSSESEAANCIWINNHIIMPVGYPITQQKIKDLGYQVLPVNMSEFQKLDGGVSCLSLRF